MVATFGLTSCAILAGYIIRYERFHGPLHYQYDSRTWSGAEGCSIAWPRRQAPDTGGESGLPGELWDAVSLSGEPIVLAHAWK